MEIDINVGDAIRELKRGFRDLSSKQVSGAVSRSINHTLTKTRTEAGRGIRQVYNVKAAPLRKAFLIQRSTRLSLTGRLLASTASLPLLAFGARQTARGASVAVKKGERKVIPSAFIQTMPAGHKGVFGRGRYQQGNFQFRKKRIRPTGPDLPIGELRTVSAHTALTNSVVLTRLADKANEAFATRLVHELRRASK